MSERGQKILIIWGLVFMYIYGFCLWGLLRFMPPPPAYWSATQVAHFYVENEFQIRLGAMITSWTGAFALPISIAAACQLWRVEKGVPVWSLTTLISGGLMSMFLVFPPILWGVAAFTPERAPDATLALHELGTLTLTTTDQFYIFGMVAMGIVSLSHKDPGDGSWPFPRWMGFFTFWTAIAFEVGAIAFMTKHGPFAWNGLLVFWMPLIVYGTWMTVLCVMMLRALRVQSLQHDVNA